MISNTKQNSYFDFLETNNDGVISLEDDGVLSGRDVDTVLESSFDDVVNDDCEPNIVYNENLLLSKSIEGKFTNYFKSQRTEKFIEIKELYDKIIIDDDFLSKMELHEYVINDKSRTQTNIKKAENLLCELLNEDMSHLTIHKFYEKGNYNSTPRIWATTKGGDLNHMEIILIDVYHMIHPAGNKKEYYNKYNKILRDFDKYKTCISEISRHS